MNGFSNDWETEWDRRTSYPEWPWTDLVSKVNRYTDIGPGDAVLELGCGAGANVPFFRDLGVNYYGIEGSEQAVTKLTKRFRELKANIAIGDFTAEIPFEKQFDCVVDRSALTTNSTEAITACLKLVSDVLRPGGKVITVDMFSTEHSAYEQGQKGVDTFTRVGFEEGVFANLGEIHFCSEEHVRDLFGTRFDLQHLEHKIKTQVVPKEKYQHAAWDVVAAKI
jgi:cyclopropane fatty-acyl-phospholipid synthase-like methyltransferase